MQHNIPRPFRESALFMLAGGVVAVIGQLLLWWLTGHGWPAGWANVAAVTMALQLNFAGGLAVPRQRRLAASKVRWWRRWWRFHIARGAGAGIAAAAFPAVATAVGTTAAYWSLVAAAALVNFSSDRRGLLLPSTGKAGTAGSRSSLPRWRAAS